MATTNTTIVKIPLTKPSNKFIILRTTWSVMPFQLDIMLLDADCPSIVPSDEFAGTLSMESIEAVSKELDEPVERVLEDTKSALATDNGSSGISYELESDRFRWYKNGIFQMGTVDLEPAHSIGIDLLLTSLRLKSEYRINYDRVCDQLEATKRHHEQTKAVYDRFVVEQTENEEKTLTKFLALLNEKKAKIGQLENLLHRVRDDGDEAMDSYEKEDRGSERKSNEPSTSAKDTSTKPRLRKRKPFSREQANATSVAVNHTASTSATPSTSAAAEKVRKSTENNNNESQDSVYSKNTEELYGDM